MGFNAEDVKMIVIVNSFCIPVLIPSRRKCVFDALPCWRLGTQT